MSKIVLVLVLLISWWNCMTSTRSISLGINAGEMVQSQYISRFSVPYDATFTASIRLKLQDKFDSKLNFPVLVLFFDDDEWIQALHTGDCLKSKSLAKYELNSNLRGDGEWNNWETYEIPHVAKNQVWYVVVSDCAGVTHMAYPQLPYIDVELHMLNSGSEFSHEEYGVMTLYIILFLVYVYFLATTSYKIIVSALRRDEIENAIVGCVFAIYMELLHIVAQIIHMILYSQNGKGFFLLDLISTVLQMNSQITIVGILILIAFGWEIIDVDFTKDNKFMFLGGAIIVFHTWMAFLTAFDDGEHHKYHDFGGFQGFALSTIRVVLYVMFIYGIIVTIKAVPKKAKGFLKALSAAGTMYILAFPTLWFFSFIITAYLRNRLIVFGNLFAQLLAIIILLNQLSKKDTKFHKASAKSKEILHGKSF